MTTFKAEYVVVHVFRCGGFTPEHMLKGPYGQIIALKMKPQFPIGTKITITAEKQDGPLNLLPPSDEVEIDEEELNEEKEKEGKT